MTASKLVEIAESGADFHARRIDALRKARYITCRESALIKRVSSSPVAWLKSSQDHVRP